MHACVEAVEALTEYLDQSALWACGGCGAVARANSGIAAADCAMDVRVGARTKARRQSHRWQSISAVTNARAHTLRRTNSTCHIHPMEWMDVMRSGRAECGRGSTASARPMGFAHEYAWSSSGISPASAARTYVMYASWKCSRALLMSPLSLHPHEPAMQHGWPRGNGAWRLVYAAA